MENPQSETCARDSGEQLSRDRLFELLSAKRRRQVVASLQDLAAPVGFDELAGRIVDRESRGSTESQDDRDVVRKSLYHRHLPKLEAADVVNHDRERNVVEPAPNFEPVAEVYDSLLDADCSPSE